MYHVALCGPAALPQQRFLLPQNCIPRSLVVPYVALPQYHQGHLHSKTVALGFATAKHPVKVTEREHVEIMLVA